MEMEASAILNTGLKNSNHLRQQREPSGIMGFDEREIQHIHHPPMQKTGISMSGKNFCNMIVGAFFENQSVKHTVDQVAQCAGKNQPGTNDISFVIIFPDQGADIIIHRKSPQTAGIR